MVLQQQSNGKLFRWTMALQKYNITFHHIRGVTNNIADFLSRHPEGFSLSVDTIPICALKKDPTIDTELKNYLKDNKLCFAVAGASNR